MKEKSVIIFAAILVVLIGVAGGTEGSVSNGERIYYTATSDSGSPISFSGGPQWLYMHGGSCVDCHGEDGRGGIVVMMSDVVAPDIRYDELTGIHGEEGEGGDHEEHPPYTDELIKIAINQGLGPDGESLDHIMPRWRMSEEDLDDLLAFLQTLDGSSDAWVGDEDMKGLGTMGPGMMGFGMMGNWYGPWFGGLWIAFMLALPITIVLVIVFLVRSQRETTVSYNTRPLEILKLRYAKGEISRNEFEEIKRGIE